MSVDINLDKNLDKIRVKKSVSEFFNLCIRAMFNCDIEGMLFDEVMSVAEKQSPYNSVFFDIVQNKRGNNSNIIDSLNFKKISGKTINNIRNDIVNLRKPVSVQNITTSDYTDLTGLTLPTKEVFSALFLPLIPFFDTRPKKKILGVFGVFAPESYVFGPDEKKLLLELALNLSEKIIKIRRKLKGEKKLQILRNEKEMYKGVFENTGTGTIIIDRNMLILFANTKFADLTGYDRTEIENKMKWSEFVVPLDSEKMQYYHNGRRQNLPEIPTEYHCRIFNKLNHVKHIHMKVGMIPGADISIASFMDISQRKLAEERLRKSESQLRSIISTFEGFIHVISEDFTLEFVNRALAKRTGAVAIGGKCYSVVNGLEAPCPWCRAKEVFAGKTLKGEEKSPKDERWYSSVQSPIYDDSGKIYRIQTILIDITERKEKEEKIAEKAKYQRNQNIILRSMIKERHHFEKIVGKSQVMQNVYERILKAAASNAHVIVYGESGTGKELVAHAIHNLSNRKNHKFVPVNCGAIPEHIIESEFFGYKKGAFTGADYDKHGFLDIADGGTLFLDEIGDIGLNIQVKLLRVIEGGGYTPVGSNQLKKPDLRIVAATNKNLKNLVIKGLIREDFFYRIHIIPIKLPSLRERKEDLQLLIEHFLSLYGDDVQLPHMSSEIMGLLNNYDWPGNVRELQNVIHRFVTLKEIAIIENLPGVNIPSQKKYQDTIEDEETGKPLGEILSDFEKNIIFKALEKNRWQKITTASYLGIHRKTLFTKMKKYGLL